MGRLYSTTTSSSRGGRLYGTSKWSYQTGAEEQEELIRQYQDLARARGVTLPSPKPEPSLLEKFLGFVSAGETAPAAMKYLETGDIGEATKKYGQTASSRLTGKGYGEEATYADVLKKLGMREEKIVGPVTTTGAAGLALDILLDPMTYLGGKVLKAGGKLVGKPVAKTATKIPGVKKVASTLEEMFVPYAKIKKLPGEIGEEYVEKTFKPFAKGLRYEQREAIEKLAKTSLAAQKELGPDIGYKISQAIETGTKVPGAEKYQDDIAKLLEKILTEEKGRGLISSEIPDYVRHFLTPEAREYVTSGGKISAEYFKPLQVRKAGAAKQRKLIGTIDELNKAFSEKHGFNLFEPDIYKSTAGRTVESLRATRTYDFLKDVERKFGIEAPEGTKRLIKDGIEYTEFYPKGKVGLYPLEEGGVGLTRKVPKFLLPKPITEHLEETAKILTNDEATNEFLKFYDKALGLWKGSVTGYFPAFHGRNFLGGVFNNYIAGVKNPLRYHQASKLAGKSDEVIKLAGKNYSYRELYETLAKSGAIGEQGWLDVMGTIDNVSEKAFAGSTKKALLTLQDLPRTAMDFVENRLRGALFIDEMAKGKNVDEAIKKVFKYHFDYAPEGLTTFERGVMRRLVPFYTFARNNTPLQIEQMLKQPGKYAGIGKTLRTLSGETTGEEGVSQLPEYMRRSFPIRLSSDAQQVNYLYGLGLPIEDLSNMTVSGMLAKLSPILKVPLELAVDKNFYFDKPISDFDSAPQAVQKYAPKPIKDLLDYSEEKIGGHTYATINPIKWHILSSLFGRTFYTMDKLTNKDVSMAIKFLYTVLGLKGKAVDIEKQRYYSSKEAAEKLGEFLVGKGEAREFNRIYIPKEESRGGRLYGR